MKTFLPAEPVAVERFLEDPHGVIDRMNYEGACAVIESQSGHSVIVMPRDWISVTEDQDFRLMLLCAVRYSLGRHTYMPDVISRYVDRHMHLLDEKTINLLIESVKGHLEDYIEHEPYPNLWQRLLNKLTCRRDELKVGGSNEHEEITFP